MAETVSAEVCGNEPERWAGARSSWTHPHRKERSEMARATGKSSKKGSVCRGWVFSFQDAKQFGAGQMAEGRSVRRLPP